MENKVTIEDYEIIHNARTGAIGVACNSRAYKITEMIEGYRLNYDLNKETGDLKITNEDGDNFTFLKLPEEYHAILEKAQKVLIISSEPSSHPEDSPEIEAMGSATKYI